MISRIDPNQLKISYDELQKQIPASRRMSLTGGFAKPKNTEEWIFVLLFDKMQG